MGNPRHHLVDCNHARAGPSTPDRPSVAQSFSQEDGKLVVWKHAPKREATASSETVFTGGEAHISCTAHKARFMEIYRWQELRGAGFPQHRLGSLMRNMARGMGESHHFGVFVVVSTTFFICAGGQDPFDGLNGFNLNPPYFNLAEGSRIYATATCGEDEAGRPRYDLYCKLVGGPTTGVPTENIQVRKNCMSEKKRLVWLCEQSTLLFHI